MEKRKQHQSFRLAQQWRLLLLLFLLLHSPASAAQSHNYVDALHKSLFYCEAQRSGRLPYNQRVGWRDHSRLTDGLEQGVDLVGGYYDAGDPIKFGLPMEFTVTMLSWGVIEYLDEIDAAGELEHALEATKWDTDHYCWQRSKDMTTSRQAYKVDENNPGSDLAGETVAAMAAASTVFRKTNPHYSQLLLHHAQQQEDESIGETGDCNNGSWSLDTGISSLALCSHDRRPSRRSGFPVGSSCILSPNQYSEVIWLNYGLNLFSIPIV